MSKRHQAEKRGQLGSRISLRTSSTPDLTARNQRPSPQTQMDTKIANQNLCPRCYQPLAVADVGDDPTRAALLACPEPYCDYVLVLTERETFSARKWSWPDMFRFTRAAS